MKEPATPIQPEALKEWSTPELIVEEITNVTRGGGTAPLIEPTETAGAPDPEYYAS